MIVRSIGNSLMVILPDLVGKKITYFFDLVRPLIAFKFQSVKSNPKLACFMALKIQIVYQTMLYYIHMLAQSQKNCKLNIGIILEGEGGGE